jgi:hypothetical protein
MVELNDKQKLALYKKSQSSGYSIAVLEQIYLRGYNLWNESFTGNPEQFGFDRVNSFIAGGYATELDSDLLEGKRGLWDNIHAKRARIKAGSGERMRKPGSKGAPTDAAIKASQNEEADPCWDGYKQVGMKKKGGKKVPNCVPEAYTGAEKTSKDKNKPNSRFDATTELVNVYAKDTPGQSVLETIKRVVSEATYKGKTVPLNKPMKGDVKKSKVYVDPDGDGKAQKVNFGSKTMSIKKHIKSNKDSYCARSGGQGNLTDTTSANYWSRRAWDC